MEPLRRELVLVTGSSGFVGSYCIVALLREGYKARSTIRSQDKQGPVLAMVEDVDKAHARPDNLSFAIADLVDDRGWEEAMEGCAYVLHVASPFPTQDPKDVNELIKPAVEGTLRVLRAAQRAGVKRVVLTSSFGAIGYGHPHEKQTFDESDWTIVDGPGVSAYIKSKVLAERAAWDFVASEEGRDLELAVVNPPGIFGPVLGDKLSGSISLVKKLLEGAMPGCPNISFGVVDVRGVADLHVLLMKHERAAGQRIIASTGAPMSLPEIAAVLKRRVPRGSGRVPTLILPDFMVRMLGWINKDAAALVPQLGKKRYASNDKAKSFGWTPRSAEDAIVSSAESLLQLGIVGGAGS